MISSMGELDPESARRAALREDLLQEYYAILGVVSAYDGWSLIVKGWSVTLSLAGLGLGFQQRHFAMFGLAAITGAAFWFMDGLMKGYQYRYYVRMRDIEYSAYLINAVALGGDFQDTPISAPRVDMTWGFKGFREDDDGLPVAPELGAASRLRWRYVWRKTPRAPYDWRAEVPHRRKPSEIHRDLQGRFLWLNVALPHVVAVVLGSTLFVLAALNSPGLEPMGP